MNGSFRQRDSRFMLFGLSEEQSSWRGVVLLAAVFVGSLVIAAVLTPPAYWLVEWWHHQTNSANAQWLLDKGPDVYFDRLRMLIIVLALPWLMTKCHLWSWKSLGLSLKNKTLCAAGWWLGGVGLILGLAVWRGIHPTVSGSDNVVELVATTLFAGLILGFLEETIFRGMILRICYTAMRQPWVALNVMAAFFAYTHFKVPGSVWLHVAPGVHWDTGFFVAFWTTFGITENFDLAQFVALWMLGLVLGGLTLRSGSLWPAIGLHAGLVSAMFFYRGSSLTEGWDAAAILAVILLLVVVATKGNCPRASNIEHSTSNPE
ncbi:MAG TPA: CPBP family glutamic-type intramembrane protease [Opitutales bacterium]|jgi:membrane protease YdiL (CAAX protease family)|nr:CPBP family glutamic-type intramembrane protease [Opitutales bacterium]